LAINDHIPAADVPMFRALDADGPVAFRFMRAAVDDPV
jgi:hypothetical protein